MAPRRFSKDNCYRRRYTCEYESSEDMLRALNKLYSKLNSEGFVTINDFNPNLSMEGDVWGWMTLDYIRIFDGVKIQIMADPTIKNCNDPVTKLDVDARVLKLITDTIGVNTISELENAMRTIPLDHYTGIGTLTANIIADAIVNFKERNGESG